MLKFSDRNDPLRVFLFVALLFSMGANFIYKSDNDYLNVKFREVKAGIFDSILPPETLYGCKEVSVNNELKYICE